VSRQGPSTSSADLARSTPHRRPSKGERGWLILSGLAGIGIGVMVLFWTNISALALLYVIGTYAITGMTELVVAIGGRRLVDALLKHAFAPPKAHRYS
jgi:uncharacterized membrane protein HdeD (DUF308 family)